MGDWWGEQKARAAVDLKSAWNAARARARFSGGRQGCPKRPQDRSRPQDQGRALVHSIVADDPSTRGYAAPFTSLSPENRGQTLNTRKVAAPGWQSSPGPPHFRFRLLHWPSDMTMVGRRTHQGQWSPTAPTQDVLHYTVSPDFAKRNAKQVRYFCFVTKHTAVELLTALERHKRDLALVFPETLPRTLRIRVSCLA